jgi:glucose-1-phosphate adenylyltransferase
MDSVLAFILAGGQGKRMGILSYERPKPALPFAGTTQVIDFTLSNCLHSAIDEVILLTDYERRKMANYLENWLASNEYPGNISILQPRNGTYLGTADAMYQNLDHVDNHPSDLVMVLAGDHVYKMDYRKMVAFHCRMRADVTIAVTPVPFGEAHRFGIVATDDEGQITDFIEKPRVPPSNLVSMGIYVFNKQVLMQRLIDDATLLDSPHDFGHAIIPDMVRRDRAVAYKFQGYWRDIGNPQAYYDTSMELLVPNPSFSLDGTWPVVTRLGYGKLPKLVDQENISNSLISPGCIINGRVENSILSPGVRVADDAEVRNSIVMANSEVGYHSVIDRCILDEEVCVGRYCYLGFGGTRTPKGRPGVLIGTGAEIPPHTAIGGGCWIMPLVSPADFNVQAVPANSVISPGRFTEPLAVGVQADVR